MGDGSTASDLLRHITSSFIQDLTPLHHYFRAARKAIGGAFRRGSFSSQFEKAFCTAKLRLPEVGLVFKRRVQGPATVEDE